MMETKMNGKSEDMVYKKVQTMKNLFPEVFSEDKIDFDKLKLILGGGGNSYLNDVKERYDFIWNGKTESIKLSQTPSEGTLRPDKKSSKNWNTTENLYIEGDNLEILKLLQKSYYGKIKMIYLDPPYNTGKDFVYQDDFKDNLKNYLEQDDEGFNVSSNPETSGRYHTNWLNMMYPRLKLSRNLLTEDGVIFISIDDNEFDNLKKICNEIFGESNLKATFCWRKTHTQTNIGDFARVKEYILCYSKNKIKSKFNRIPLTNMKEYRYKDEEGNKFRRINLIDGTRGRYEYEIINPNGNKVSGKWMKPKKDLLKMIENKEVYWAGETPYGKNYLKNMQDKGQIANDFLGIEYGTNQRSTMHLDKLMGNKRIFDFSKPTTLIKHFINLSSNKNSIILDFFAGSSTTAHSIFLKNIEDKKNRKFIMVQLPEKTHEKTEAFKEGYKNICEIGKERIRRAGDKLLEENPDANIDIGFKVFKLDSSNLTKWNPDVDNLEDSLIAVSDNLVEGRSELDLVYEIMLKYGLELTLPVEVIEKENYTFYNVCAGSLVICLNDNIKNDVTEDILEIKNVLDPSIMRVVFKDNGFVSDSDKTNVKEILRNNDVDEFITI